MVKIDIEHFDLEFEKDIQTTECFIELHDTYFRYVSKHDSSSPKNMEDLELGWEEKYHDFDFRIKRESFISVEYYWNDKNNYWQVEMESNGYPVATILYFKKEKEEKMKEVFETLFNWVFNK
jgi:hypothetical protein